MKHKIKKYTEKSPMTCSKKILLASYICGITLTLITMTALVMITGFAYGEFSVWNDFYYNKAKHENAIKIAFDCMKKIPDKINDNTDIATLINAITN